MRTIRIIDLLNKLSRGTPPKKIRYHNLEYEYDKELKYYYGLGNLGDKLSPITAIINDDIDILGDKE